VSAPRAVAVVVPARNEEALIGSCLDSVEMAAAELDRRIAVITVVVADDCQDATASIAREFGATVHVIARRSVGAARSAGVEVALKHLAGRADRIWLANTDADSVVPRNWLVDQLALASRGWDAVIGTVRPDFAELSAEQAAAWRASHVDGIANGHVHGANLGVRASSYLDAGGFSALPLHEDNDLVRRLGARRARIVASAGIDVVTSGRQEGRTPGGYAQYLREQLVL
jgi:glycosyltransferase involved in cell wall biosynthesis